VGGTQQITLALMIGVTHSTALQLSAAKPIEPAFAGNKPFARACELESYCLIEIAEKADAMSQRRMRLFERPVGLCNDVGWLAEAYDFGAQRAVGNFPQAFPIAMVNGAYNVAATQKRCDQLSGSPSLGTAADGPGQEILEVFARARERWRSRGPAMKYAGISVRPPDRDPGCALASPQG
jgi:hypothetical protein